MFSISHKLLGKLKKVVITNKSTNEFVCIVPSYGACLHTLSLKSFDQPVEVITANSSMEDFLMHQKKYFSGAKLFPFANRILDGKYTYKGKSYTLEKNDPFIKSNALHGLVYDKPFKEIKSEITSDYASILFEFKSFGSLIGYPFPFKLQIEYKLSIVGLTVKTSVINTGNESMPFVSGWHPYLKTGTPVDKLQLKIDSTLFFETDQSLTPTGKLLKYNSFATTNSIKERELNHCFKINHSKGIAKTLLRDIEKKMELTLWQETGPGKYNYLQLYTPPDRLQLAVEPMTGPMNAFNNHIDLLELSPEEVFSASFGISLKQIS